MRNYCSEKQHFQNTKAQISGDRPESVATVTTLSLSPLVELKNGETYNGHLVSCDNWMNINLREVICTSRDGDKFWRMPECYIRGSTIKYLRIPDEIIDMVKEEVVAKGRGRGGLQQQKQQKGRGMGGAGRGVFGGRGRGGIPGTGRGQPEKKPGRQAGKHKRKSSQMKSQVDKKLLAAQSLGHSEKLQYGASEFPWGRGREPQQGNLHLYSYEVGVSGSLSPGTQAMAHWTGPCHAAVLCALEASSGSLAPGQ
ncbi:hypothetical protein P7K49_033641 [Saguinus oedipus]|uniref:Sm domain-containing protein n=1 Tax=Saguinus oedipus TaxID=9490 RepID=A0ABQ9TSH5_SAGOE|nr:hypothetical protein P7K49_033641 [Saguinus oedipus]